MQSQLYGECAKNQGVEGACILNPDVDRVAYKIAQRR